MVAKQESPPPVMSSARNFASVTFLIAFSHFALELCHGFLPVMYPLLIESIGLTYAQVGVLALTYSLFAALTQPIFGYWSDRWRPELIVVFSIAWTGIVMGLVGFVQHYWLLVTIIALGSLGSAAYHPAGASLANTYAQKREGMSMSLFSVGGNLGAAGSPLLVGAALVWFDLAGTTVLIPITLLTSFLLYQKFRQFSPPEKYTEQPSNATSNVQYGSWLALGLIILAVGTRSWVQGSLMTYLPEWLQNQGYALEVAGSILSMFLASVSIGSLMGGTLSDRVGRIQILVSSLLLIGPIIGLFLNTTGIFQIVFIILTGILVGASYPVTILIAQETWPQAKGFAASWVIGIGWFPAGLGSWVLGLIADQQSLTFALHTLIVIPLIGVVAVLLYQWRFKNA